MKISRSILLAILASAVAAAPPGGNEWAQWRGPLATGVSPNANPPVTWSERQNIRWKIAIPGMGHSTPVVWGDRLYLTAAVPSGPLVPPPAGQSDGEHDNFAKVQRQKFIVLAVSRQDGKILWQREVAEAVPHEVHHETGSDASASPITDGERVFAHFGSRGLYCLGTDGAVKWKRDFGQLKILHAHGEGSTPVLHGNTLIVNWDHEGEDFVVALDKRTGKTIWQTPRKEATSWSTPIVVVDKVPPQVIVSATSRVRGYDLANGSVIWECGGLSDNVVASPVAGNGMVFAGSSYDKKWMVAIRLDGAKGDITNTDRVVWTKNLDTPYVPSPLLHEGNIYYLRHFQGMLSCVEAVTGKKVYGPVRLPDVYNIYSSLVAAAGRLYITSREGITLVVRLGDKFELLATNRLDDAFSASAALAEKDIYLRGERSLYCISEASK